MYTWDIAVNQIRVPRYNEYNQSFPLLLGLDSILWMSNCKLDITKGVRYNVFGYDIKRDEIVTEHYEYSLKRTPLLCEGDKYGKFYFQNATNGRMSYLEPGKRTKTDLECAWVYEPKRLWWKGKCKKEEITWVPPWIPVLNLADASLSPDQNWIGIHNKAAHSFVIGFYLPVAPVVRITLSLKMNEVFCVTLWSPDSKSLVVIEHSERNPCDQVLHHIVFTNAYHSKRPGGRNSSIV